MRDAISALLMGYITQLIDMIAETVAVENVNVKKICNGDIKFHLKQKKYLL